MQFKKIVAIADMHCGHVHGLTPPEWQSDRYPSQKILWDSYVKLVHKVGKVDLVVLNGDALEGKGRRNEGIELITSDRDVQCDMAVEAMGIFNASRFHMTYGTPYHTGCGENFEHNIASALGATIESRAALDINGLLFDIRHFAPASQTPMGPTSLLQREKIMAILDERIPKGGISVRSHIHKFYAAMDHHGAVFTTPCLQTHSDFGSRKCSGDIDLGFMVFNVASARSWSWEVHSIDVKLFRREAIKF
jgi:hypothetical protein